MLLVMPSNCLEMKSCPFLLQRPTVRITIYYLYNQTASNTYLNHPTIYQLQIYVNSLYQRVSKL